MNIGWKKVPGDPTFQYIKGREARVYKFSRQKFSGKLIFKFSQNFPKTTNFTKFITKIYLNGKYMTVNNTS